jgi:peptide-methionine (S)-S-oxide reductase
MSNEPSIHEFEDTLGATPSSFTISNFLLVGALLAGGLAMTSFIQRFLRPFSSSTLYFAPEGPAVAMNVPEGAQKATLAAGCFWGIEHMYRKDFEGKGLIDARVGYIGGNSENPSYQAVCSGRTGRKLMRENHQKHE